MKFEELLETCLSKIGDIEDITLDAELCDAPSSRGFQCKLLTGYETLTIRYKRKPVNDQEVE